MAQQHLAHFTLSDLPHLNGGAVVAYVGKDGNKLFPTDHDEAYPFRTSAAAAKAAARVERTIRSAAAKAASTVQRKIRSAAAKRH